MNSLNPFGSSLSLNMQGVHPSHVSSRSRLISDTIVTIAVSALSLLAVPLFLVPAPGFAAALGCVPVLAVAIWIIRRCSCNNSYRPITLASQPVYVQPTPVFVQPHHQPAYTSMHSLPTHRQAYHQQQPYVPVPQQPIRVVPAQAQTTYTASNLHALPTNRSTPIHVQPLSQNANRPSVHQSNQSNKTLFPLAEHR